MRHPFSSTDVWRVCVRIDRFLESTWQPNPDIFPSEANFTEPSELQPIREESPITSTEIGISRVPEIAKSLNQQQTLQRADIHDYESKIRKSGEHRKGWAISSQHQMSQNEEICIVENRIHNWRRCKKECHCPRRRKQDSRLASYDLN
jgi:hypothetical protein